MRTRRFGCVARIAALALLWASGILVARLLPLGNPPANASERRFFENAVEMRHSLNNHPFGRLTSGLFVYRISVSGLRPVPGSCDGGSDDAVASYRNVAGQVTDHSLFGLPIATYGTTCGGWSISRGAPDYRPGPTPGQVPRDRHADTSEPPRSPRPPPPEVRPPPAP